MATVIKYIKNMGLARQQSGALTTAIQIGHSNIRDSRYLTEMPSKELFGRRLYQAIAVEREGHALNLTPTNE